MEEDPYSALAGLFDIPNNEKGNLKLRRGLVLEVSPLSIAVGGIMATGSELCINTALLEHTERLVPTGDTPPAFEARVTAKLSPGDTVLTLSENDQQFYVLCKVVTL